jgi:hypothetical protein
LAETKNLHTQKLMQEYEQRMEAVLARKTLSLENKRSKAKEELTKVREVVTKRKESPIGDVTITFPRENTPTSGNITFIVLLIYFRY